jgi:hypothetical protein
MERKSPARITGPDVDTLWERMKSRPDSDRWGRDRAAEDESMPDDSADPPLVFVARHRPDDPTHTWFFRNRDAIKLTQVIATKAETDRPAVYNALKRSVIQDVVEPLAEDLNIRIDYGTEDDGREYPNDDDGYN